ncbi:MULTISPECIES: aliphatic sulfonate ABC transporter substrate-binding protein [Kurthia]|uniref:aliphatic sulfonate ABC transporter substrate-binding protein n=1 Tax=Kurthia TaxID=1649 RepID=UPI0011435D75|nr:aliphatic sulfonate ABC transporter substrate-binding protein [Kurthia gibsonii]GED19361.1 sulfonate ABC transporter substrate-binding protein [Kurthia gibsonii]
MKKTKLTLLTVITLVLLVLTACGSKSKDTDAAADSDKVVKIGYQKGNTINILKESGYLEKNLKEKGYKVEWREFSHGGTLLEGLFTGNIDFGHAADGSGITAQAGNKPFVYVGADKPNPEGIGLLVLKDSGIKNIKELKGKKVGVLKGGNHHYLAMLAVEDAGLKVDDIEWVYLQDASQLRTAFETKAIDALGTYDPFFAGAETDLDTVNLTEGKDYDYPNRTFYYANEKFNQQHPELVEVILDSIAESDEWANKNKPEVVKLVSKALGINEKVIKRAIDRRTYGLDRLDEKIIKTQQAQADYYTKVGLIPQKINVSERVKDTK